MSENKVKFKTVFWPSLVAGIIVSIIGTIIFIMMLLGVIGGLSPQPKSMNISDNTILHMKLDGRIAEEASTKFNPGSFDLDKKMGLSDILYALDEAEKDDNIKGIFIELGNVSCGMATGKEIRDAINDFEESGKFVVAYNSGEAIGMMNYYISSAAKENYAFPTSAMNFLGLGAELMFYKNTFEKMGVEMQIVRGPDNDFKSAVEPFFRSEMSDSSRFQLNRYLNSIWEDMRKDISADRGVSASHLNTIAENAKVVRAEDGVAEKMFDKVMYRDEVIDILRAKLSLKDDEELNLQDFNKYAAKTFLADQLINQSDEPNVAVIIAEGGISVDGDEMTSKNICKLFQDARANESVKTVVFRVNSPGGSALASDEIWREVKLTNEVKKVIVSMGDVAASGGYYISAPADKIYAEPTTITGSIGVFGMIPYIGDMLDENLGITFDRVQTNKHSILSLNKRLTDEEREMIEGEVSQIYDQFMGRVAEGRGMTVEQVNVVARGRVWTGRDALAVGLVDELGGLEDAIAYAAKQAGITETKVIYYPLKKEDKFAVILEELENSENVAESQLKLPAALMKHYESLKSIEDFQGIQMRLPFFINFE